MFKLYYGLISLYLNFANTVTTNNEKQCKNNNDCLIFGNNYTCVSVQTKNKDLIYISQCIQEPICGGNTFGNCPYFTNWDIKYNIITPECSFSKIDNCKDTIGNDTVDCYNSSDKYGIYKCVDSNTIVVNYNNTINPTKDISTTTNPTTDMPIKETTVIPVINNSANVHIIINSIYLTINIIILILILF